MGIALDHQDMLWSLTNMSKICQNPSIAPASVITY
jgi:hypothetical protein